jgi:hypothetical protein
LTIVTVNIAMGGTLLTGADNPATLSADTSIGDRTPRQAYLAGA